MRYKYIHCAYSPNLFCVDTKQFVKVEFPTMLEIVNIPGIVKKRETEAIERYESIVIKY